MVSLADWMFGRKRRLVWRFEWLTLLPDTGALPQISHRLATSGPPCASLKLCYDAFDRAMVIRARHGRQGWSGLWSWCAGDFKKQALAMMHVAVVTDSASELDPASFAGSNIAVVPLDSADNPT